MSKPILFSASHFEGLLRLASGAKYPLVAVVMLQVLVGFAENLTIVSILPIIEAMITGATATSGIGAIMADIVGFFGLPPVLHSFIGLAIAAATLRGILDIITSCYTIHFVLRTTTNLRQDLARRMYGLDWTKLSRLGSGHIVAVIVSEIERARPAFSQLIGLCTGMIQILTYIATSLFVSAPLTFVAVVLGLIKVLLLRPLQGKARTGGRRLSEMTASMNGTLFESLQNMKMLKAMGRETVLLRRFLGQTDRHHKAMEEIQSSSAWLGVLDEYMTALFMAVIFLLSATLLDIGIAEIAVVGLLMNRLLTRFGALQKASHAIGSHAGAIEALEKCVAEWPKPKPQTSCCQSIRFQKEIRLDMLSVYHDSKSILEGVSLTLTAGKLYALVGSSGSGKTTLVDTILGLHAPFAGRVLVDGEELVTANQPAWQARIGYVPQELVLFNDTILFNLLLDAEDVNEDDAKRALVAAEAWDFVKSMPQGLHSTIAERGTNLSGGQRQRLALARALVHAKDLLIIDEATSALDPSTERDICTTLRKLSGEITIIAISHQLAITEFADEVIEISHKKVIATKREPGDIACNFGHKL